MKTRILTVLVVAALAVLMVGCNAVQMNGEYSKLLDQTAALASETDARWDTLTPAQQKQAFHGNAELWQQFKAAKDGKEVADPTPTPPVTPVTPNVPATGRVR